MSVLDIEEWLTEITADAPCGEDLEYDPAFSQLEELAQGRAERQYGDTIIPAEPPDWPGVRKTALGLMERTRDLRVAVYLARSLLYTDALPGFAAGLGMVQGLLERFWDSVHPQLDPDDENDPTLRINTLMALCDPEATLRGLREVPLVSSRVLGRFSLRDVQIASGALTPVITSDEAELPTQAKIDGAFQDADLGTLQATLDAVTEATERVESIEAVLTDRVGVTQAPDMSALSGVLRELRQVLADQLRRRGVGLVAETATPGTAEEGLTPGAVMAAPRLAVGEIGSREDAMRMLDKIGEYFERCEPSSPVPFLLKRAKKLVSKDFMAILHDLAPGGTEQATLIFGLQSEDASD